MEMPNLLKTAFVYFAKVKVVHSIPGRLRLQIPGLNNVPNEMKAYEHYVVDIIKLEEGIKEVNFSYITGKILLTYDPEKTNEKRIVSWLDLIWKKIIENERVYAKLSLDEIKNNLDKFYELLCKELEKGR